MSNIIQEKLSQLSSEFDKLQTDTQEKGEKLFDAKRADLYEQSCDDIDCFVKVYLMFCFFKIKRLKVVILRNNIFIYLFVF